MILEVNIEYKDHIVKFKNNLIKFILKSYTERSTWDRVVYMHSISHLLVNDSLPLTG